MKLEDDGSGDNKEEDIAIDEVQTDDESDDTQVSKSQTSRFANLQNIEFNFEPEDGEFDNVFSAYKEALTQLESF